MSDGEATDVEVSRELPSVEELEAVQAAVLDGALDGALPNWYIPAVRAAVEDDPTALSALQRDAWYNPFTVQRPSPWRYAVLNESEKAMHHMLDWGMRRHICSDTELQFFWEQYHNSNILPSEEIINKVKRLEKIKIEIDREQQLFFNRINSQIKKQQFLKKVYPVVITSSYIWCIIRTLVGKTTNKALDGVFCFTAVAHLIALGYLIVNIK